MSRVIASERVSVPELATQIADQMRAFDASLDLLDHTVAALFGISRTDLRALELVSRRGPVTAGQLADALKLTTGAVTGLIDRLEKAGFVRRQDDPGDRRKVVVEFTARGRERERRAYEPLGRETVRALSRYTPNELRVISDFLRLGREQVEAAIGRISRASPKVAAGIRRRS